MCVCLCPQNQGKPGHEIQRSTLELITSLVSLVHQQMMPDVAQKAMEVSTALSPVCVTGAGVWGQHCHLSVTGPGGCVHLCHLSVSQGQVCVSNTVTCLCHWDRYVTCVTCLCHRDRCMPNTVTCVCHRDRCVCVCVQHCHLCVSQGQVCDVCPTLSPVCVTGTGV